MYCFEVLYIKAQKYTNGIKNKRRKTLQQIAIREAKNIYISKQNLFRFNSNS